MSSAILAVLGMMLASSWTAHGGSMCCHDSTQDYCGGIDHTCQCANQTEAACTNLFGEDYWRDEVARDGPLKDSADKGRYSGELECCPDSVIKDGEILMKGCTSSCPAQKMSGPSSLTDGQKMPIAYACMGYNENAKIQMGACDVNDLLFWTTGVGSYSICRRKGAAAVDRETCAGATLQVSMSMAQVRLGSGGSSVLKTYKLGTFASIAADCHKGMSPGWRWRGPAASDADGTCDLSAKLGRQMEFEQPFEWRNMSGDLLGTGWSMTQLRFNSNESGAVLTTHGQMGSRCFYSAGKTGSSGIESCPRNTIGAGGVKFVLELDQSGGADSYPHGASDFWTECEAEKTAGEDCAHCFVADFSLLNAMTGSTITSSAKTSSENQKIEVRETDGDTYVYSFEDIVNVVAGGYDFDDNGFGYDFKQGSVVLADGSSELNKKVYVCLPKASYDPSNSRSTPCPNNLDKTCAVSFLYDPEMSIEPKADQSGLISEAGRVPAASLILLAILYSAATRT